MGENENSSINRKREEKSLEKERLGKGEINRMEGVRLTVSNTLYLDFNRGVPRY